MACMKGVGIGFTRGEVQRKRDRSSVYHFPSSLSCEISFNAV